MESQTVPATSDAAITPAEDGPDNATEQLPVTPATTTPAAAAPAATVTQEEKKWPGWPGDCVFRLIVPVLKVGSIIGRKGDVIKKMCEETRARIRVLEGAIGTADRIVLISGKEEPDAQISPAMDAVIRVFKRVQGLPENEGDDAGSVASGGVMCSIRLLVASSQAINLIGKQGSLIKSIQESTGATVRVLSGDEVPFYATSDERIVEIQGESLKVLKALEAVVGHLRKFLVDHSVIPLFEKTYNSTISQDRGVEAWPDKMQNMHHTASQTGISSDYSISLKRDSLFLDRETQLDSQIPHSGLSLYGQDPALSGIRSSTLGRPAAPIVTQVTQTMQIPLSYAEDIIGTGGANIAYIRRTSGAILTVQESRGHPDEITVEIKGSSSQVQTAQQLIQECFSSHKEPISSSYGKLDTGLRPYSQLTDTSYPSSSLSTQPLGGYGSSGGYSSYRF
ncbi:RNA-binding KH domain-containing protein PEPPER-like isoform X1 [Telopea speciosissima]|uniref:RNA-binding KH domain-containing protein PEPPER-like isoform X1 n=1 Tax=Telopea speciosissima TaxID=54955 RepID=UPI001CC338F3|nr:RNA-binding KH domain-containing protein PEPPER-like isoform X1 [Telopea speciosissima]XP_043710011.1 RNA-binding KH domain-containing protein PEPPER-like isoform X2 [Telopea speciosissima]XP_043710012.1 RNA-binding KH domain-containing protein PEPPER-like isoform X1 [Telopea speciosissima]